MIATTFADILIREFAKVAPLALLGKAAEVIENTVTPNLTSDFNALLRCRTIGDVMSADFISLPADTYSDEAMRHIALQCSTCVVLDNETTRKPVGLFTEREALRLFSKGQRLEETRLGDSMMSLTTCVRSQMP